MSPTISTSTPTRDDQDTPFTAQWLKEVSAHQPESQRELFAQAVHYVEPWLIGVRVRTGERIDKHCAAMIPILQQLGADVPTQAAALLAYLPQDAGDAAQREQLQAAFGTAVTTWVPGTRPLYKMAQITARDHGARGVPDQRGMNRKRLGATAVGLRIVFIRWAPRLQSLLWFP